VTELVPVLVAVAIAGLAGGVALARRPPLAAAVLALFDIAYLNGLVDRVAGISLFWPLLAVGFGAIGVLARRGELRLRWSPLLTIGVLVLAVSALAFAANPIRDGQWAVMTDRLTSFLFAGVVYVLVVSTRAWRTVAWTVVGGLAAICLVTVAHAALLHSQGDLFGLSTVKVTVTQGVVAHRHGGTSEDVNFWGRALLLWTPLALSAWALTRGRRRWLWLAAFGALLAGIYLTQSRGSFLAIVPAVLCWFVVAGRRYSRLLAFAPLVLLVALPLTGAWARLATITSIVAEQTEGGQDQSLVDRARQQRAGFDMFLDSPALGQGTGAFKPLFPEFDRYADESGTIENPVGAHNFFIEQLAEGGIVGFTAWALLLGGGIFVSARTIVLCRGRGETRDVLFAAGIVAGLTGWAAASIFLHLSDLRGLLTILALAAALDTDVRGRPPLPFDEFARRQGAPRPRRIGIVAATTLLGASLATIVAGAALLSTDRDPRWEVRAVAPVLSRSGPVDGTTSFATDIITRGQLAATYGVYLERRDLVGAAATFTGIDRGDTEVSVFIPKSQGSVGLLVAGSDQDTVAALAPVILVEADAEIDALGTPFVLDVATTGALDRTTPNPYLGPLLVVVGGLGVLAALAVWARLYRVRVEQRQRRAEPAVASPAPVAPPTATAR
jgi:O-antigen ligase